MQSLLFAPNIKVSGGKDVLGSALSKGEKPTLRYAASTSHGCDDTKKGRKGILRISWQSFAAVFCGAVSTPTSSMPKLVISRHLFALNSKTDARRRCRMSKVTWRNNRIKVRLGA